MAILLANNASSRLASSINTSVTTLSVTTGHGALFPSPSGGDYFPLTVIQDSGLLEIMKCTARSGDVLTVTRAQEGSSARSFAAGERVELRFTVAVITAMNTLINGATQGPASAVTDDVALFDGTTGKLLKDSGYKVADFYRKANILGTVSQTAGVPTGSVIERGSSGAGEYVRYADGTQICMTQLRMATVSTTVISTTWTYPIAFLAGSIPRVSHTPIQGSLGDATPPVANRFNPATTATGATTTSLRTLSTSGSWVSGDFVDTQAIAIGQWY